VAFTKNASRNEWLLEKATEMGVQSVIPIIATRTEREKIRYDRWKNILVSAILQSQQFHLPHLLEATSLKDILSKYSNAPQKLVAHCMEDKLRNPLSIALQPHKETLILIGPEGDFTAEEVALCEAQQCKSISLGDTRLRTETAAMAACAYFNMINHG
jgi:16S rRNA (uracil1498-N3)-methyltransferase